MVVRPLTQEARQRQMVALDEGLRPDGGAGQRAGRRVMLLPSARLARHLLRRIERRPRRRQDRGRRRPPARLVALFRVPRLAETEPRLLPARAAIHFTVFLFGILIARRGVALGEDLGRFRSGARLVDLRLVRRLLLLPRERAGEHRQRQFPARFQVALQSRERLLHFRVFSSMHSTHSKRFNGEVY